MKIKIAVIILIIGVFITFKSNIFEPQACKVVRNFFSTIDSIGRNEVLSILEIGNENMKSLGGLSSIELDKIFEKEDSAKVYVAIIYNGSKGDNYLFKKIDTIGLIKEIDNWSIYLKPLY